MKTLLIRAEDKNIWERRAPLIPKDVKEIINQLNVNVYIQKSEKRFFPLDEYTSVGAKVCDDMIPGDIILGIKEIPENKLLDQKIYLFFSHTIKGQQGNMPMLKRIIQGKSTLIDYEKIIDKQGTRHVYFGRYAGDAGAIDILWLMGQYWKYRGIETPFELCKQAIHYQSVNQAQNHFKEIGTIIKKDGLPREIIPLTIGILGYGNVSIGAQQIFNCLPIKSIEPEQLESIAENQTKNSHTIYLTIFKEQHLVEHKQDLKFVLNDYYNHPHHYVSQFEQYLPYLTIIFNAIYWDSRYPRFVTWDALKNLYQNNTKPKLNGIADITCDIDGSIECNVKTTNSSQPAYLCDPMTKTITDGFQGDGILMLAVDNLPAELPNDSSIFFSNQLKRFIPNILNADFNKPLNVSGILPEIQNAVIVYRGELTSPYKYLNKYLS